MKWCVDTAEVPWTATPLARSEGGMREAATGEDPGVHSARQMQRIPEGSNEGCSLWELSKSHSLLLQQLLPEPQVGIPAEGAEKPL